MDKFLVACYWRQREEALDASALRIVSLLESLKLAHVSLSRWFRKSTSYRAALAAEIAIQPSEIAKILATNNSDTDNMPIQDLGFRFSAWNGEDNDLSASVSVLCGASSSVVMNNVVLRVRTGIALQREFLQQLLVSEVAAFEPDHGIVRPAGRNSTMLPESVPIWLQPGALYRYEREAGF